MTAGVLRGSEAIASGCEKPWLTAAVTADELDRTWHDQSDVESWWNMWQLKACQTFYIKHSKTQVTPCNTHKDWEMSKNFSGCKGGKSPPLAYTFEGVQPKDMAGTLAVWLYHTDSHGCKFRQFRFKYFDIAEPPDSFGFWNCACKMRSKTIGVQASTTSIYTYDILRP